MTSLKELCRAVDRLGVPWANEAFADGEEPAPPFICIVAGFSDAAWADNAAWASWMSYDVALYTRQRDYELERRVESALDAIRCPFTKTVTLIGSEKLIEAAFSVNVSEQGD